MNFTPSLYELSDLKKAFDCISDEDGLINFNEFYYSIEKRGLRESSNIEERLLYSILSRIIDNKVLNSDKKINFQ